MSGGLLLSSLCLVAGGALLVYHFLMPRRPALATRVARAEGAQVGGRWNLGVEVPDPVAGFAERLRSKYERELRHSGEGKTPREFLQDKVLLAVAFPLVPLMPYAAAAQRLPSVAVVLALAAIGFVMPDLALRSKLKQRREAIFLDLPEAIAVMALALGAGQSLRQALDLAARDCTGALGDELARALSLARRERQVGEREALVRVAREAGEESFARFAELLAAKESPYLEFLRGQAAQARAEQNRYLERAADRAYLAMHAPLAPLLAVLVLLVAYGFLHFLAETI